MIEEMLDVMIGPATSGMTMMVVTHKMGFARQVTDEILFIAEGEYRREGDGQKLFLQPANRPLPKVFGKKSHMSKKAVGILGGMGSEAAGGLFAMIIAHTPAEAGAEHLHVIIDSNPGIFSRRKPWRAGDPGPCR